MEIQSDTFGFNRTLSKEGSTCEDHNKDQNDEINQGKVKMDFHSHFSYDSDHNYATTFEHVEKFIYCMYENNMCIKDGIIYDTRDVCSKKYICEDAM